MVCDVCGCVWTVVGCLCEGGGGVRTCFVEVQVFCGMISCCIEAGHLCTKQVCLVGGYVLQHHTGMATCTEVILSKK